MSSEHDDTGSTEQEEREDTGRATQSYDYKNLEAATAPANGRTLLPTPVAKLVSGGTGLLSFYVRAGSKVGGWGLSASRVATLKTLSVTSNALEAVLVAAGRDASSNCGQLAKVETESILERSVHFTTHLICSRH